MSESANAPAADESAVAVKGTLGGLGDFTTEDLLGSVETEAKGTATAEEARESMGNRKPRLEKIKVKHQGLCAFEMPDGSVLKGTDGFVGVVVGFTFHNSYFGKPYDDYEEGDRPPCFSHDGVNVAPTAEEPEAEKGCKFCPRNRDAQEKDAREKAFDLDAKAGEVCSNYFTMAVLLPGLDVPYTLRLSNQSFGPWAEFVQQLLTKFRARPYEVATHFRLKNIKKRANEFSVAQFEVAKAKDGKQGLLPEKLRTGLKVQSANYTSLLRREADLAGPGGSDGASSDAKAAAKSAKAAAKAAAESGADAGL